MLNLFIITLYFIIGKDLLRFIENYFAIPIPLNLISFTLVVISICVYFYDLRRCRLHYYHFFALNLVFIDFMILSINMLSFSGFTLRDMVGIMYVNVLVPLFVILTSNKINFYDIFFKQKKLNPIIIFVLLVGIAQLSCFKLFPEGSIDALSLFYKNGWMSWPFQVSAVGIYPRVMSIFYAAFPFGLALIFVYAVLLFSTMQLKRKIILSFPVLILLFFTYNRNSYLAFGVITLIKLVSVFFHYKQRAVLISLFLIVLVLLNIFTPIVMTNLPSSYFNSSEDPFSKTTTVGSRVKAWNESTKSLDEDFIFGKGNMQGTKNSTSVADNFIIYKIQLNGFLLTTFWLIFFLIIIAGAIKGLLQYQRYSLLNAALLASFLVMANFNNLFYEPIFQSLYMGTILSILRAGDQEKEHRKYLRESWL